MQRLRIAYAIINANRRDGGGRALNEVAERLARRHEVHLFARTVADLDLSRIRWHTMPGPGWPEVADFVTYHCLANFKLRVADFDIIHSIGNNAGGANVITIPNIQPAKRPFLIASGSRVGPIRGLSHWLYLTVTSAVEASVYSQRPGRRPPLFLPVSRGVERDLRTHYDIGAAPVRVIPNAADTAVFRPLEAKEKARWRQANGLSAQDVVLVFVGGEWGRKGLEFALRALAYLPERHAKLLVLGQDAAEAPRFARLARDLGVSARVVFAGFRRDVADGLGASDLFVFPSRYEAFSLATLEAAACGLPVLAPRISGAEDLIQPGYNGEFIEHDPEQIARTLRPLVTSAARRQAMGQAARRCVEQYYTWDRIAALTEAAYFDYLGLAMTDAPGPGASPGDRGKAVSSTAHAEEQA